MDIIAYWNGANFAGKTKWWTRGKYRNISDN